MSYIVTDMRDNTIKPGDEVVNTHGTPGKFEEVVYGPRFNGVARVRVSGREYPAPEWGLEVGAEDDDDK